MQIVRDLAGYSYGRSDLVRRAMSKKKASVMEKERKNFVYGNEEEGVPGCIANGIPEAVANHIYDEMTDFAKYAFNKSHAAGYAVVCYQTAYLKCYYPVEFMAALMTSMIDNPGKVAEYIFTCRQMGIGILPPDINEGEGVFTVADGKLRYGMAAIKGLGRPVIDAVVKERTENGRYKSIQDFIERLSGKEVNKRTLESFIKSGAFDGIPGTRKQLMLVYAQILDGVSQEKKNGMTGQMSLFDFVDEEAKQEFEYRLPDCGEYDKEQLLAMEKEVLGVYISGHPLESYEQLLKKNCTVSTLDFIADEETGNAKVSDGAIATIGGMITAKKMMTTRTGSRMAFLTIEDMAGAVEVIVFPRDYEKYKEHLEEDNKILVKGRISAEEEKDAKLICQEVIPFDAVNVEVWIKYKNKAEFVENEQSLYEILSDYDGNDTVCIYCECEKAIKRLPKNRNIKADNALLDRLRKIYSDENVKVVQKKY